MKRLLQILLTVALLALPALANTLTVTWAFSTTTQSWTFTAVGSGNAGALATTGCSVNDCLNNVTTGRNKSGTGHWDLTGTWETLFGVPAGSTVTSVGGTAGNGHWWKCQTFTTGAASTEGPFEIYDSTLTLMGTFSTGQAYSATTAGATVIASSVSVPSGSQPSGSTITLRLNGSVNTGASNSANNTLLQDTVVLTVTYTPGPNKGNSMLPMMGVGQ